MPNTDLATPADAHPAADLRPAAPRKKPFLDKETWTVLLSSLVIILAMAGGILGLFRLH